MKISTEIREAFHGRLRPIVLPIVRGLSTLLALSVSMTGLSQGPDIHHSVAKYDVSWSQLGASEEDSMPLGNGDLAANVWTEQGGDVVILLAKSDAYTELGKLVKLGRIRLHLAPAVFTPGASFTQRLDLENGAIQISSGPNSVRVWIDANHNALHVESHTEASTTLNASLETWRVTRSLHGASPDKSMPELGSDNYPVELRADTVLPQAKDSVTWYHFNDTSIYPTVLQQQHLQSVAGKYPDPLLHRCFGATMFGADLISVDDKGLRSSKPSQAHRLDVVALTEKSAASPKEWLNALRTAVPSASPQDLSVFWQAHVGWWEQFWNRSWIDVTGDAHAQEVSQGYAMQRFMMATSSRGEVPTHFNGGLFTVGRDMAEGVGSTNASHNPDYRAWGDAFWNQNNRLLYWPLLATGDYDLLKPWFDMYLHALPLAIDRTQIYYHHGGASMPETMFFWGLPSMHDFGWNNPSDEIESRWQRYHIQGTLEVISQMLDYYDATGDASFASSSLVPFADAIVTYYSQHYPEGSDGKLVISPAQSLETYQLIAVNPTPDVAGLRSVLPRMLALPSNTVSISQIAAWKQLFEKLPDISVGRTTDKGKTPPMGIGDPRGTEVILPAERYGKTSNSENPELYTAFPYHLYGVGKSGLKLAQDTYMARRSPQNTCWGQDGTQSAALGLTEEARKAVIAEFTNYGDQRFRWFWKAAHDWIPDLDDGGDGMITLQEMLLQTDGRKILLVPAWPKDWTADFRLHAPYNTTVEAHVSNGRVTAVTVTPKEREKDLVVVGGTP